ncbi:hypothetical protein ACFL4F_03475 [Candidatus Margulisiibacteriota bacterium]
MKKACILISLFLLLSIMCFSSGCGLKRFTESGMKTQGMITEAQGDLRILKVSVESYKRNNGAFPSMHNYQDVLIGASPQILIDKLYDGFAKNPKTEYGYRVSSSGKYFVLYSVGPSRKGSASISNAGIISVAGEETIWESNGSL